ncbi:MAG: rod shape-determining protein RodA [Chlamydiota bacterium]|nr:rod shape-determining protein RodA [Chlamydiota bacterium]
MLPVKALRYLNYSLISVVIFILAMGLLFIYSASYHGQWPAMVSKQFMWIGLGVGVFWFVLNINLRQFASMSYILYGISVIFLVAVLFIGADRQGARSWFNLGLLNLQPSEFAKLGIVFALARFYSDKFHLARKFHFAIWSFLIVGIPMVLMAKQPDLGTAMVLIPVVLGMLFVAGYPLRYFIVYGAAALSLIPLGWHYLHDYQRQRILVFLNPNLDPLGAGYTAIQSKIAIGSGGLIGKGWLEGTQNQLQFLPERHTDFIFSVLGEEWGFMGCFILICLYLFLVLNGMKIAKDSTDLFGKFLACGVTLLLVSHIFINIGMTVGLMPITGIPLPLMSYGGSHLVMVMIVLGLLENVHLRKLIH